MVNQKVVSIASQAAADHMARAIKNIHVDNIEELCTVYWDVFHTLMDRCNITQDDMLRCVTAYVQKHYPNHDDRENKGIIGNIMKESKNPNMGVKVFNKLIKAIFPES